MDEKHFDAFTQSLIGIGSRRRLLRLAGVLPLGTLLSTRIVDNAAAGDLGGRHGNNNRGRDKNRDRGPKRRHKHHKHHENTGLGVGPDEFEAFTRVTTINQTGSTISLSNWGYYSPAVSPGINCKLNELVDVLTGESHLFEPLAVGAEVIINDRYYVDCFSDNTQFPFVRILHGTIRSGTYGCPDVDGQTDVGKKYLGVGQSVSTTIEGFRFEVKREADFVLPVIPPNATTPNERSFILTVSHAS